MRPFVHKAMKVLGSRLARNIYLWVFILYVVLSINSNNERGYHYGIIRSPWYWRLIVTGTLLQMILLYGNNLVLMPRLLLRKRPVAYFIAVLLLISGVSLLYVFGLKTAQQHINVASMQQVGFVSFVVNTDWSLSGILSDTESYFWGNVMWVIVFAMAWFMNDYARQRRMAEQAQLAQVHTELAFLKNQLNPHFLFNTMNNLYSLTLKKSDTAPDAVLKLSLILRYLLYESDAPQVSFGQEQEIMQAYIDLELLRLRDHDRLRFSVTADSQRPVPPLLWMPVLENVFKHGTRTISREQTVEYRYHLSADRLHIYSRNDIRQSTAPEQKKGIGLENLAKRLHLLYPGKHTLRSGVQENAYITEVNIDLS